MKARVSVQNKSTRKTQYFDISLPSTALSRKDTPKKGESPSDDKNKQYHSLHDLDLVDINEFLCGKGTINVMERIPLSGLHSINAFGLCLNFRLSIDILRGSYVTQQVFDRIPNDERHGEEILFCQGAIELDDEVEDVDVYLDCITLMHADISFFEHNKGNNHLTANKYFSPSKKSSRFGGWRINHHAMPTFIAIYVFLHTTIVLVMQLWDQSQLSILASVTSAAIVVYLLIDRSVNRQSKLSMFVNGWNAWSFSGVVHQGSIPPMYSLPDVFTKSFHAGTASIDIHKSSRSSPWIHEDAPYIASDHFTILSNKELNSCIVAGYLSQHEQFSYMSLNYSYNNLQAVSDGDLIKINKGRPIVTDILMFHLQDYIHDDPFDVFMTISGRYNKTKITRRSIEGFAFSKDIKIGGKSNSNSNGGSLNGEDVSNNRLETTKSKFNYCKENLSKVPVGWCSWYHFYSDISEHILLNNIDVMSDIKKDLTNFILFQIDDGYQIAWGDWLTLDPKKFPFYHSLRDIVTTIKMKKFVPGLWMAPFSCDKHSSIAKNHPEWLLYKSKTSKGEGRTLANSAFCGKWFYAFDLTISEVRDNIRYNIKQVVQEWGIEYLKLDFLYSAVTRDVRGLHSDRTLTRAQIMQLGMHLIRDSAGDNTFILGCGAPMGSVIGHVQANRVSSDAGTDWFPLALSNDKWNLPCARNMMRNTITRGCMHKKWWINDPDCILLRKSTSFTDDEIIGMATIKGLCGGSIIVSDDLVTVPKDRLRILQQILPPTNHSAIPLDLLEREMPEILRLHFTSEDSRMSKNNSMEDDFEVKHSWNMIALSNWDDKPKTKGIHLSKVIKGLHSANPHDGERIETSALLHMYDFWRKSYTYFIVQYRGSGNKDDEVSKILLPSDNSSASDASLQDIDICDWNTFKIPSVPSHSCRLIACSMMQTNVFQYIGSNLHFSCGYEIESITRRATFDSPTRSNHIDIVFKSGYLKSGSWGGNIIVYLPCEKTLDKIDIHGCKNSSLLDCVPQKIREIHEKNLGDLIVGSVWRVPVCQGQNLSESFDDDILSRTLSIMW